MKFAFDISTLYFVLLLTHAASVFISIILYISKQIFNGARSWIVGQLFILAGTASMLVSEVDISSFSTLVPIVLYFVGQVSIADAIWKFRHNRRMPTLIWVYVPLFVSLFALLIGSSVDAKVIAFSAAMGPIALFSGGILFVGARQKLKLPCYLTATAFILVGVAHLLRIPLVLFGPQMDAASQLSIWNAPFYLVSILSAYVLLFGYFLMSGVRYELDLLDAQEKLSAKHEELARYSKIKGMLLSVLAHDLRSPISSAVWFVEKHLLGKGVDLNEKRKEIGVLGTSLRNINVLLEDLILWARNQDSEVKVVTRPIPLQSTVAHSVDILRAIAESKGVSIAQKIGSLDILADGESVSIVMRNLISNAIKFTKPGGKIQIESEERGDRVIVTVSDTGIGMSEELIARLEGEGEIVSTLGTSNERGNGLGLLLCRTFMHKNSGEMRIESASGKGSSFILDFKKA